ncbi:MAG: [Oscillospiraceae bacterium]|nr:[FeFe] hydrogenase H-cluster radical SAM maturase HydE [Oscillospiraceae bacterium]
MDDLKLLIDKLAAAGEGGPMLTKEELVRLIGGCSPELTAYGAEKARAVQLRHYGNRIFVRGLIEYSSYCKNDCLYCGLRRSNRQAERYRLDPETVLACCGLGYELGFRTFVLQGGEDPRFTDEVLVPLVKEMKERWPDCAVTLSLGERSRESYQKLRDAGADRYLLRHEAASEELYSALHPAELRLENRKRCLRDLKELGYQVGAGFMVGAPGQTAEHLAEDMLYLFDLQPEMVGIGPFLPHHDTPFRDKKAGSLELTVFLLALTRLMLPKVLLPATTALGTLHPEGREMGVLAGANVIMPNLSPDDVKKKYLLYDGKISTGDEAAEAVEKLRRRMADIGYEVVTERGDHADHTR